jgi:hypothetical protein
MHKAIITVAAIAAGVLTFGKADAMPLSGIGQAADSLSAVEKTQFIYGGRNYCWYPDGWHGPGFYWCGYAYRTGFGWGGPIGWHGWRHGGGGHFGGRGGVVIGGGHRMGGGGMGGGGGRMGGGGMGGGGGRMGGGGGGHGGGGGGRGGGGGHHH